MSRLATRAREPSMVLANLPGLIWVQCARCSGPASVRIGALADNATLSCIDPHRPLTDAQHQGPALRPDNRFFDPST